MGGFLNKIGLSMGEFQLKLDRHDFEAGETLVGEFHFRLKKIVRAKAVLVGIRAYHGQLSAENKPHYEFEMPIDGPDKYLQAAYRFELLIPSDAVGPGGVLGQIGRAVKFMKQPTAIPKQLKWEIWGRLDIPGAVSPQRTLQITVSPPAGKTGRKKSPPSTDFYQYEPPALPVRKKATAQSAPTPAKSESSEPAPKEPKKPEGCEKKETAPKKRRELKHYAPPALEKPSRLKLPEPTYDDLPKHQK